MAGNDSRHPEIADAARVIAWARDPDRKPAATAFTAGAERQAAYWIEWAQHEKTGALQITVDSAPALVELLEAIDPQKPAAPRQYSDADRTADLNAANTLEQFAAARGAILTPEQLAALRRAISATRKRVAAKEAQ
jgi:hypothetical protein